MIDTEEWRSIPGWLDYEVSSQARVRRVTAARGTAPGRIKTVSKPCKAAPYPAVKLCSGNKAKSVRLHVLVCEAFHGPRPAGMEPNHIDGKKTNNIPSNLEWLTKAANTQHAYDTGLTKPARGEAAGSAVLTELAVAAIKRDYTGKYGEQTRFAKMYGTTQSNICRIVQGKVWSHVQPAVIETK